MKEAWKRKALLITLDILVLVALLVMVVTTQNAEAELPSWGYQIILAVSAVLHILGIQWTAKGVPAQPDSTYG